LEITIDKLSYGGAGVGRVDGKVFFVEGGVPGDKLKIKLVEEKESYSRAEIEDFIVRSEKRTEPECKFFTNCGGCNWQDVNYKTQLIEKQQIVSDSLQRYILIRLFLTNKSQTEFLIHFIIRSKHKSNCHLGTY